MNQRDLAVFADWNDALTGIVHALGGFKKVGVRLRPELEVKPEQASQWLRDCFNPEKRERLNPDQVLMLMRLARASGWHAAKHWLDAELGYEQGRALDPVDEALDLNRRIETNLSEMRQLVARLERLGKSPVQNIGGAASVHSLVREGST
jgi:hypothetical protein